MALLQGHSRKVKLYLIQTTGTVVRGSAYKKYRTLGYRFLLHTYVAIAVNTYGVIKVNIHDAIPVNIYCVIAANIYGATGVYTRDVIVVNV